MATPNEELTNRQLAQRIAELQQELTVLYALQDDRWAIIELAKINKILLKAGIAFPTCSRGVQDLATMLAGVREERDELQYRLDGLSK